MFERTKRIVYLLLETRTRGENAVASAVFKPHVNRASAFERGKRALPPFFCLSFSLLFFSLLLPLIEINRLLGHSQELARCYKFPIDFAADRSR